MEDFTQDIYEAIAFESIRRELEQAKKKHPSYPTDPLRRTAIMMEEAGEAIREAVDLTRPGNFSPEPSRINLLKELVQTGAMCVRAIAAMEADSVKFTR